VRKHYPSFEEKFWSKVEISDQDKCWRWIGAKRWNGYGKFTHLEKTILAHRASYQIAFGSIEKNMVICHKCDNRWCVNPNHLWSGTQGENLSDMFAKGRNAKKKPRGSCELHPRAKVDNVQVKEIIERYSLGESSRKLASVYGISKTMILNIVNGKNWKNIDDDVFK
jgi:hypothetical protein